MTTGIYEVTDTWNDGGTVFTAFKMTVTDTAYAAGSYMIDISALTGNGKFVVSPLGDMHLNELASTPTAIPNLWSIYTKTDDRLYYQDGAGVEHMVSQLYGIMSVQGGSTAEATTDATPRKIAAWNTDGISDGVTVDHTTDDITIDVDGVYKISASISFSGSNSSTYLVEIHKNGVATGFALLRKLGTGGDVGNTGLEGIVSCVATDTISLYHSSTDGGTSFTVAEAQLSVHRLYN